MLEQKAHLARKWAAKLASLLTVEIDPWLKLSNVFSLIVGIIEQGFIKNWTQWAIEGKFIELRSSAHIELAQTCVVEGH